MRDVLGKSVSSLLESVAAFGALWLYMELQEESSSLRLKIAELRERLREWSIRRRVENLIEGASSE